MRVHVRTDFSADPVAPGCGDTRCTLDLTARLSPTASRHSRTAGGEREGRGGILDLLDIGNLTRSVGDGAVDEWTPTHTRSLSSPLSPLDSTLEHLKNLVGVGGAASPAVSEPEAGASGEVGHNGSDQPTSFELNLGNFLHVVSAPGMLSARWRMCHLLSTD